ncbi:MAG: FadR family transcriptional regulator, partial [Victivallales bacterium]|nr:FadR family transcriptional regulator [Victivallales bacterium]
ELSERLGVSRTVLREALQRFKVMGMIESKRKSGMVLKRLLPNNLFEPFIPFIDPESSFGELLDMRVILEMGMAEMLVERISDDAVLELEILAVRMREASCRENIVKLDNDFHNALFEAVDNKFLNSIRGLTVDFFAMTCDKNSDESTARENYENHTAIVETLRLRNIEAFRDALNKHYNVYRTAF